MIHTSPRAGAFILLAATLVLTLVGVCMGSSGFQVPWSSGEHLSGGSAAYELAQQIVWDIRLPRTLGAWLAGALLGLAGALAQGVFRNPLADPYLLGSASGASLGVALTLSASSQLVFVGAGLDLFSAHAGVRLGFTSAAFIGAALAVMLTLLLARGTSHTLRLLLAGVVVAVVLGAFTSLVLMFSPETLQSMQGFMLGSTSFVGWTSCAVMFSVLAVCLTLSLLFARVLDGLSLGDATALSLGLPVNRLRMCLILTLALATGTAVAQTGLIAFVGLVAPHLVRACVRVAHRGLLLGSSLMGGVLLLAADVLSRGLLAPQELPIGTVTAIVGGSYLLWLMSRNMSSGINGGLE